MDIFAIKYAFPNFEYKTDDINILRETARFQVFLEYRGKGKWCVSDEMRNCYDINGKSEWEPSPSNRDEEFFKKYRFCKDIAFTIVSKALKTVFEERSDWYARRELASREAGSISQADYYKEIIEMVLEGIEDTTKLLKVDDL